MGFETGGNYVLNPELGPIDVDLLRELSGGGGIGMFALGGAETFTASNLPQTLTAENYAAMAQRLFEGQAGQDAAQQAFATTGMPFTGTMFAGPVTGLVGGAGVGTTTSAVESVLSSAR